MAVTSREFKNAVYEQLARVGKALSSGPRLEILEVLCQGPRTVEVLAHQVEQPVANTSHHLQALRRAGLVLAERDGVHVRYRLAQEDVCVLFRVLREVAEAHLLEIEAVTGAYLLERGSLEAIDAEALLERLREGEVTLLDVRPTAEFEAGHLPDAISLPLAELERRLAELPRDREVIAYCRGPYCVMALDAVAALRARGFQAVRMAEGVPDWRARGLPVQSGPAGSNA